MEAKKKKSSRWLARQRLLGNVKVVGVVQRKDTGRPEVVHGRWCRPSDLLHEVMVAEVEVLTGIVLERGKKWGRAEPDGVGQKDGKRVAVEVDHSANMTQKQMNAKWKRYGRPDGFVLVVAMSEARMRRLMAWGEAVKDVALFTTFERLRSGIAEPWVDRAGHTVGL